MCIYKYIYIKEKVSLSVYICGVYAYVHVCLYINICISLYIGVYVQAYLSIYIYTWICSFMYMYSQYIYIYIYEVIPDMNMCIYMCTNIYNM